MKEFLLMLGLATLIALNVQQNDKARSTCADRFGSEARFYSRSALGVRCLTPAGTIEYL